MFKDKLKLNLTSAIMVMIFIPSMLFVVSLYNHVSNNLDKKHQADLIYHEVEVLNHISKLIGKLQVERGTSAVFIKSGRSDSTLLVKKRAAVDELTTEAIENLTEIEEKIPEASSAKNSLMNLKDLRLSVDNSAPLSSVLKTYTNLITSLRSTQKKFSTFADGQLKLKILSFAILEASRENAGLLRANLSAVLTEDKSISDEMFFKLISLYSGMFGNLQSDGLALSDESLIILKEFDNKNHWKEVNKVFKVVLSKSASGEYGYEGSKFFKTISQSVDDIAYLLSMEIKDISQIAKAESHKAFESLLYLAIISVISTLILSTFVY